MWRPDEEMLEAVVRNAAARRRRRMALGAGSSLAVIVLAVGLVALASAAGDRGDLRLATDTSSPRTTSPSVPPGSATVAPTTTVGDPAVTAPSKTIEYPPRPQGPPVLGEGTLTLSGAVEATARFSMATCGGVQFSKIVGFSATLPFHSESTTYYLDVRGRPGRHDFENPDRRNQSPATRLRLSFMEGGEYLNWGFDEEGRGEVSGDFTFTFSLNFKSSGSFDMELGFVGSDSGTLGPGDRDPLRVTGSWNCRPFVAGAGTLEVSGDLDTVARFSGLSCEDIRVSQTSGLYMRLEYQEPPGGPASRRIVMVVTAADSEMVGLAIEEDVGSRQYLQWGSFSAADPPRFKGTLTRNDPAARSGAFEFELDFAGVQPGNVATGPHGPISVRGDWSCP